MPLKNTHKSYVGSGRVLKRNLRGRDTKYFIDRFGNIHALGLKEHILKAKERGWREVRGVLLDDALRKKRKQKENLNKTN